MRYCPNCMAEYESTVSVCSDCEVLLVNSIGEADEIHSEQRSPAPRNFVTVFESANSWEAQTVRSLLESHGIPCKVLGALESNYPPTLPIEVQVPEELEADAEELMAAYQNGPETELGI